MKTKFSIIISFLIHGLSVMYSQNSIAVKYMDLNASTRITITEDMIRKANPTNYSDDKKVIKELNAKIDSLKFIRQENFEINDFRVCIKLTYKGKKYEVFISHNGFIFYNDKVYPDTLKILKFIEREIVKKDNTKVKKY